MTTPSTTRKAGPFTGNGSQTSWPFTFKVFAAGDVKVTIANAEGTESVLVLDTDYTVSLNSNQETSPGGAVAYALPSGFKLTITGDLDYDQAYDIPAGGNFNPVALENQLDRMVMQTQQLAEQMVRAVKVPVTDDGTGELSGDLAQGILALGPVADDITTVAEDIAAVENVSANMAAVSQVATNIADVTNFADVYQGPKASAPTLRNDGSALQVGDLYFDTPTQRLRAFGASGWTDGVSPTPVTIIPQAFSGNGTTTTFTLSAAPAFPEALDVYISGVQQSLTTNYTVSGTTLTFNTAPPSGTSNIRVKILSAYAGGVPNLGSVGPNQLQNFAVQTAKLDDGAVTEAKIANDAVTALKIANDAVTFAKMQNIATAQLLGRNTAGSGDVEQLAPATVRALLGLATVATSGSASDLGAGSLPPARLNASGSAPVYGARAWVHFNGTGVVSIDNSANVSSVTDSGNGSYAINFTTAMPDVRYVPAGMARTPGVESGVVLWNMGNSASISIYTVPNYAMTTSTDFSAIGVVIFR